MTTASSSIATPTGQGRWGPWLFSAPVDLLAFLGSAVLALMLLAYGGWAGLLHEASPEWTWVPLVLLIDVAHVYATGFRVYFDRQELARRPLLYGGGPLLCYVLGVALYSESDLLFWRVLAYLAVFHFIRQQYGWVALYRARAGERDGWGKRIDSGAIYAATLYPLLYWHAHLPRQFAWFVDGDFGQLPALLSRLAFPFYVAVLTAYAIRSVLQWRRGRPQLGKDIVVATTVVCWYVGIVSFNSDYAFTVTNIIIHGVPYMVLVFWFWQFKPAPSQTSQLSLPAADRAAPERRSWWPALVMFVATIWLLAYAEELLWDWTILRERPWLFGPGFRTPDGWQLWIAPLLAVPQATHYLLDGFIWRRRSNPDMRTVTR
ncbi:hypothetical protein [Lignipirellula cremea]|uniref:Transmembrane protein n=1 Tax=Lignipirellula cremea TaxID=2528010 RepID=A0A518DPX9_9BACT|nr:hypothetical protein [Lignipirellula cremea]QDU93891.1 hypothetical protein Pla8534_16760 [Lignipirellula cremea]